MQSLSIQSYGYIEQLNFSGLKGIKIYLQITPPKFTGGGGGYESHSMSSRALQQRIVRIEEDKIKTVKTETKKQKICF